MMWQRSAPSNQTYPTHQHNLRVEDFPSDLPGLPEEETLECQEEYPQEAAEEAEAEAEEEEFPPQYQHNKQLPVEETNSLAIRHLYSQEIAPNQKSL